MASLNIASCTKMLVFVIEDVWQELVPIKRGAMCDLMIIDKRFIRFNIFLAKRVIYYLKFVC
jgi:hypothetical protein